MRSLTRMAMSILIVGSGAYAQAALVYVDAVAKIDANSLGNTTVNGNFAVSPNVGGNSGTDNLWRIRTQTEAAGGALWETDNTGTAGETTAPLVTTIPLAAGTYNIYGVFRDDPNTNSYWDAAFSLDNVTYITYDQRNATLASETGTEFSNPAALTQIRFSQGYINYGLIGQVNLAVDGTVSVFVQGPEQNLSAADPPQTTNIGQRTWYEGIAYQAVPEPSGLALASLALMGLAAYRRSSVTN